jgi:hypothetical protein
MTAETPDMVHQETLYSALRLCRGPETRNLIDLNNFGRPAPSGTEI